MLPTEGERFRKRLASSMDELQAFYDAAFPRLKAPAEYLDQYEYPALPDDAKHLLWLCYSLVNVSFPVEVWRQPRVPDSGAASVDVVVEPAVRRQCQNPVLSCRDRHSHQLHATISLMTDDSAAAPARATWRDLAVARSLDPARVRAEKRVQRFLDAALDLMTTSSGKDFTVQEVVERSGQSLRSFYQYFAGKYELLLALFEESVRSTAEHLSVEIEAESDPRERLHRFITAYHKVCQPGTGGAKTGPALAQFAQQLLTEHPKEAARAFGPLVALLEQVLDEAAAAGAIRPRLNHRRIAGIVLQAVMFNAFAATISGSPAYDGDAAEEAWSLIFDGIGPE